ncbi:uncharacterized protein PHACADRAFT_79457, partial [Phanerochaete carnosa HHB-10118-sp]
VDSFLKHVLQTGDDKPGLFGKTKTYYGTVESQGRLTLHLHLLLWIEGTLSPHEVRERVLASAEFRKDFIDYLESMHQGEFCHGDLDSVSSRRDELNDAGVGDPTERIPHFSLHLETAEQKAAYFKTVCDEVDQLILRSNKHREQHDKGCLRQYNGQVYCRSRFPREIRDEVLVNWDTGDVELKHREAWINTFNRVITYLLRCNSDITSLLSGTQVRAVIAYVTDYITKGTLTTHAMFQTIKTVLDRNVELVNSSVARERNARTVLTRIVNALTALHEAPGPMICAYLLGHSDHYTPETFKVFHWYSFVREAGETGYHEPLVSSGEGEGLPSKVVLTRQGEQVVGFSRVYDYTRRPEIYNNWCLYDYLIWTHPQKLTQRDLRNEAQLDESIHSQGIASVGDDDQLEPLDDDTGDTHSDDDEEDQGDVMRPGPQRVNQSKCFRRFLPTHPLANTHGVFKVASPYVLNFVGGILPRKDHGDREYYCQVMLILFCPGGWRSSLDLRHDTTSWSLLFNETEFATEH